VLTGKKQPGSLRKSLPDRALGLCMDEMKWRDFPRLLL
jgi:hypothetical protein